MLLKLTISVALICSVIATNTNAQDRSLGKLVVKAGEYQRNNSLVSVSLDGLEFDQANKTLKVLEVKGNNKEHVGSHIEQGYYARLWWVLSGVTNKNAKRTFELVLSPRDTIAEEKKIPLVTVQKDKDNITINVRDKNVLQYIITPIQAPEGVSDLYQRSGFIHPLRSPKGEVLTRIQPPDHYHHVGIWNPWTHTEFEGREVDFWNLNSAQGTVRSKKVTLIESSDVMGRFKAIHEHVDLTAPDASGFKVAIN